MKNYLNKCPICDSLLEITRYDCKSCGTRIEGSFSGCSFCRLNDEDRLFAFIFLQTEGNMKDVERVLGISYPTIKSRLATINAQLAGEEPPVKSIRKKRIAIKPTGLTSEENSLVLDRLASGEITPDHAGKLLRGEPDMELSPEL